MLRILAIAGTAILLAGPAVADTIAAAPPQQAAANQNKPKPKPNATLEDGRTLADYNIQKE